MSKIAEYLFHHVFLPPRLPQASDRDNVAGERALALHLLECAQAFCDNDDERQNEQWHRICHTLDTFVQLHAAENGLSSKALQKALQQLDSGDTVILHIAIQNSALIVRRDAEEVYFESFETSAPAANVLAARSALRWDFPSQAVKMPLAIFMDPSFLASLGDFLEQASLELVHQFAAKTLKAGSNTYESRDTASPALVGQLLVAILEANGCKTPVRCTRKRVYDDVCWNDGAETPWRRNPTWLVLRVGLQRCLSWMFGEIVGTFQYKLFMSLVFARLCEQFSAERTLSSDLLAFARKRVGRRSAKLQHWKQSYAGELDIETLNLLKKWAPVLLEILSKVNGRLESDWEQLRARTVRKIRPIPRRADANSTYLKLSHSLGRLFEIINEASFRKPLQQPYLEHRYRKVLQNSTWTTREFACVRTFVDYFDLAEIENQLCAKINSKRGGFTADECVKLLHEMRGYHSLARNAYKSDPQQSSSMLLLLMELWRAIDKSAIKLCPQLSKYGTGFPSDFLHVLQILGMADMKRLRELECYLDQRKTESDPSLPSMFDALRRESFQVRFYDESTSLQNKMAAILASNDRKVMEKRYAWQKQSAEYEETTKKAVRLTCLYKQDENDCFRRVHDDKGCRKCYLNRVAKRMSIDIHEALLPSDTTQAKSLVFELYIPKWFAAWRDATWLMLRVGEHSNVQGSGSQIRLQDIPGIKNIKQTSCFASRIGLASRTKSYYHTHYKSRKLPVTFEDLCRPHGPRYALLDHDENAWTSLQCPSPGSLANICAPPPFSHISAYSTVQRCAHPTLQNKLVTSNMVIARQTECPNALSLAEFLAFQDLRTGDSIQWVRLARELGSSNLNFGSPEVYALVSELALKAGDTLASDPLRTNHWVFGDPNFCSTLASALRKRLETIAANWREGQTLECLLLLIERLWSVSSAPDSVMEAERLLFDVRHITRDWVLLLRREVSSAINIETAQKRSMDAFVAALLCRKTFVIEAAQPDNTLTPDNVRCFLECAFTIKENLPSGEIGNISEMHANLKKLFISDIKLVVSLEYRLKISIQTQQLAVSQALNRTWGDEEESARIFTTWNSLPKPCDHWVTARTIPAHGLASQEVHFNILEGTLLIDSQPVGRLPEEYSKQAFFQSFFGNRVFRTYPSGMPGMSYMLASQYEGHQIHFGFRDGVPFMRARSMSTIPPNFLEFIPSQMFSHPGSSTVPDLPMPLIDDHIHWLDISSKQLVVRPRKSMWKSKLSDWVISLTLQQGRRRNSLLIDPCSAIFATVASMIEPFESKWRMVMFQPQFGHLSLKLPSLELSFRVDDQGLLECNQLHAVLDPDQDIGTFYGMESSLVLRDTTFKQKRIILVAMGTATIEQKWGHPKISVTNNGFYARYTVNSLLGRLECACDPRLIYFKAYCHAITSSMMPDPLTGRTGTEEALHCLSAGNAQPWGPLDAESYRMLLSISAITPSRSYYPNDMKVLQKVVWKATLVPGVQHDDFRPIIDQILHHCNELYRFHKQGEKPPSATDGGDPHLLGRARTRHTKFLAVQNGRTVSPIYDLEYTARDCFQLTSYQQSFETAFLVEQWSNHIPINIELATKMHELPLIDGFNTDFECHLFSNLIDMDLASHWGSLFALCCHTSHARDKYRLMFLFAIFAFGEQSDLTMVRTFIALAASGDCINITVPECSSFDHFREGEKPTHAMIMMCAKSFREAYPPELQQEASGSWTNKQRHQLEVAQTKHQEISDASCRKFAHHITSQWPTFEPSIDDLGDTPLFDAAGALDSLKEEWGRLIDNLQLEKHFKLVQTILARNDSGKAVNIPCATPIPKTMSSLSVKPFSPPSISELLPQMKKCGKLQIRPPLIDQCLDKISGDILDGLRSGALVATNEKKPLGAKSLQGPSMPTIHSPSVTADLHSIVDTLMSGDDSTRRAYGEDLKQSLEALERHSTNRSEGSGTQDFLVDHRGLEARISIFKQAVKSHFAWIRSCMVEDFVELKIGSVLPDITAITLLELLRSPLQLRGHSYQAPIVEYAQLIRNLQRLIRVSNATLLNDKTQLAEELRGETVSQHKSMENLDWCLLEIDFDLRIRTEQYQVARAMISPTDNTNSVLQLNMGQGKSSVIIPMIVSYLANAKNLVRVIVPKPLLLQSAQLIQSRLGGLIGRRLTHVPFSRGSSTSLESIKAYHKLHKDVLLSGGVMLTLPEHVLSFQLSGLQELCNGHLEQAKCMMRVHAWFKSNCRDVLDESDHMLAVKTQLIYPSGAQSMVDGQPFRWTVVQALLEMTRSLLPGLRKDFPRNIEIIERSPGSFPTVYLLNQNVRNALFQRLTDSVLRGDGNILPIDSCTKDELEAVRVFLNNTRIPKANASNVKAIFKSKTDARHQLLSLRGLLIHRILQLGLSKRWNVQYGIHPGRDPIAVPFRSKGIPSEQAEFGHPDVSIVLTCLSFYNTGLTFQQFLLALNHLLRSDEPVREFDRWHKAVMEFPDFLSSWNSINVDDETQTQLLWDHLRLQMPVVNYFLNHFVFPRHARTFKKKLTSSGWDIAMPEPTQNSSQPSKNRSVQPAANTARKQSANTGKAMTVGFSGTNDNKGLLPLNIKQNDLPTLSHTNAEVLLHLLQPRNRRYVRASDRFGKRLNEVSFLRMLAADKIRMLLDAGAQILELDNVSLAREWLLVDPQAEAAVYFGEDGRARVLFREGKIQPLATSPFVDNLGACVVYLDEAHTRGVDLKMPPDAKAALTLGIMQTKDHTVQGTL